MVLASVCRSRIRLEGPNSIFQLKRNRSGECKSIGGGLLRILQIVPNARHPLFSLIAYAYFKFLQFEGCVCVCLCFLSPSGCLPRGSYWFCKLLIDVIQAKSTRTDRNRHSGKGWSAESSERDRDKECHHYSTILLPAPSLIGTKNWESLKLTSTSCNHFFLLLLCTLTHTEKMQNLNKIHERSFVPCGSETHGAT